MSYQGWKNWDTWNASLWANNDYDTYRYIMDCATTWARTCDIYDARTIKLLGNVISGALRNSFALSDCRRNGKAWDGIDWDAVDWDAVALGFADDAVASIQV